MILEHVILPVVPGQEEEFLAAFAQARPIISSMPGFVDLTLQRGIERPHEFLMLVRWESLSDHVDGFRGSAEYAEWKALLHHFYDPFPEVVHFDMPAGDAHAPASLDEVRAAIDALDDRIIELLAERQQYVKHAAALKRGEGADAVRAPSRVEDVIAAVRSRAAAAGLAPEVAEATYRAMIDAFIELELVVHGS